MKISIERQHFLLYDNTPVAVPHDWFLPHDDCGFMVNASGKLCDTPVEAVYSCQAATHEIQRKIEKLNKSVVDGSITLSNKNRMFVDECVRAKAASLYTQKTERPGNFYGHVNHPLFAFETTASLNIGVNVQQNGIYPGVNFDWPRIFTKLDQAFREEIEEAKRLPGFYEFKRDGRVEYQSLPSTVNLNKLIDVLESVI